MKLTTGIFNTIIFAAAGYCIAECYVTGNFTAIAWILTAIASRLEILYWSGKASRLDVISDVLQKIAVDTIVHSIIAQQEEANKKSGEKDADNE